MPYGMLDPMARKQVLVQLDDELLGRLDRLVAAVETNRSELIRRAVAAYLRAADEAKADLDHVEAYLRIPEDPGEFAGLERAGYEAWPEY
jgi:metal-responsive CopG/Arc/MetJ family transcriptional regulator